MIPTPRLLPATMGVMALLFGAKAIDLAQALRPAMGLSAAHPIGVAAATEAPAASKPAPVSAAATAPAPTTASAPVGSHTPTTLGPPPISDGERAVLLDLRQRHDQLVAREAQLAAREKLLAAGEHRLGTRLDELTALQARIQGLEEVRRQHDEANWSGLVKLYEAMKPRDAATIFNDLDLGVVLPVVDRMKESKAAAILAAMDVAKARIVTAALAQTRLRANSVRADKGA